MTLGQKKTLHFGTVRLEWKTGFTELARLAGGGLSGRPQVNNISLS